MRLTRRYRARFCYTTDEFVSDAYNQSGDPLHVIGLLFVWITSLIATQLQAPLPEAYRSAQRNAYFELNKYMAEVNEMSSDQSSNDGDRVLARVGAF